MAMQVQKAPCVEKTGSLWDSPELNGDEEHVNEFDRILATELQTLSSRIQIAHRHQLANCVKDGETASSGTVPRSLLSLPRQASPVMVSDMNTTTWEFELPESEDDVQGQGRSSTALASTELAGVARESGRASSNHNSRKSLDPMDQIISQVSARQSIMSGIMTERISDQLVVGVESMQANITAVRKSVMRARPRETPSHEGHCMTLSLIVLHPFFNHFIAFTIFVNTVVIAMQTEYRALYVGRTEPLIFSVLDMCCSAIFIVELALKLGLYRSEYFTNKEWKWNVFDLAVVMFALTEVLAILLRNILIIPGATLLRVLRLVRIVRTVRALRVAKIFKELRMMVNSMVNCVRAFSWLIILLAFVMFVCSVFITHGVADEKHHLHKEGIAFNDDTRLLEIHFGSLSKSFYTLYKIISDGQAWGLYGDSLLRVSKMSAILLMAYIAFVTLAVLNVVTGIFVNFSMKAAEDDIDNMALEYTMKQERLIEEFCFVFDKADANHNGRLSLDEFITHLADPGVRAYFKFIDLDIDFYSPEKIFRLLDFDGGNTVDLKEFVTGLSKFRGQARALDMAALHSDMMKLDRRITALLSGCFENSHAVMKIAAYDKRFSPRGSAGSLPPLPEQDSDQQEQHE